MIGLKKFAFPVILAVVLGGIFMIGCDDEDDDGGSTADCPNSFPSSASVESPEILLEVDGVTIFNGGFGSSMARVPGEECSFYLLTDRGPNVDGPEDDQKIFPLPDFAPQIGLFRLEGDSLIRESVIELKDADGNNLTGLPNPPEEGGTGEIPLDTDGNVLGFDPEGIDPEGLVALEDGTFWVSDEYGPHIVNLDADGSTLERINPFGTGTGGRTLPMALATRRPNRGMEGLTITPDGTRLVGIMQSSLDNPSSDVRDNSRVTRIVFFDISG